MIRPTVALVDLQALKSNYRHIVEYLAAEQSDSPPRVIAVVKANTYGHGAPQVARALEDAGADLLACADIDEGHALREAGVRGEILVFGTLRDPPKPDPGMSRPGFRPNNLNRTPPELLARAHLALAALYTHFATADD